MSKLEQQSSQSEHKKKDSSELRPVDAGLDSNHSLRSEAADLLTSASSKALLRDSSASKSTDTGLPGLTIDDPQSKQNSDISLDEQIKKQVENPQPIDYAKLLVPSSRVVFSENTTHNVAVNGPRHLMDMMDQLSKANPPAKTLALEGLNQSAQNDIDNFLKNPDGEKSPGKTWRQAVEEDARVNVDHYVKQSTIPDSIKTAAGLKPGKETNAADKKALSDYLTAQIMSVLDEARKDKMNVIAMNPDDPPKITDSKNNDLTDFAVPETLNQLLNGKDQKSNRALLDKYQEGSPEEQKQARQELLDRLTRNPPQLEDPYTKTVAHFNDPAKLANDIMTQLDYMKKDGYNFAPDSKDSGLPQDPDGKIELNPKTFAMVQFRSAAMAHTVTEALQKNPDQRVIVSVGSAHTGINQPGKTSLGRGQTMNDYLKDYKPTSFDFDNFAENAKPANPDDPIGIVHDLHQAYKKDDPAGIPLIVKDKRNTRYADYYLEFGDN